MKKIFSYLLILTFVLSGVSLFVTGVNAQVDFLNYIGELTDNTLNVGEVAPDPQVSFGADDFTFNSPGCTANQDCSIGWIGTYVGAVYEFGVGAAAVLAVVMMMVGGFLWLISAGSPDKIGRAKEFITSALTGLLIALFSYIMLFAINPNLVSLDDIVIRTTADGGAAARVASSGSFGGYTNPQSYPGLEGVPGADLLASSDPRVAQAASQVFAQAAAAGVLPEGAVITSARRNGNGDSQHDHGRAFDISWPGMGLEDANRFIQAIGGDTSDSISTGNGNLYIIREVTASERAEYGASGPNIHIDIRNFFR